jgi:hypothetical protein
LLVPLLEEVPDPDLELLLLLVPVLLLPVLLEAVLLLLELLFVLALLLFEAEELLFF